MRKKIAIITLILLMNGCNQNDLNYHNIQKLEGDARLAQFKTLPITERFRLYNKIYENSGHPHDIELSVGFQDKPADSLVTIINDLKFSKFSDFLRYLPIIYNIGKRSSVDICKPEYIGRLKSILMSYKLSNSQEEAISVLKFERCQLP